MKYTVGDIVKIIVGPEKGHEAYIYELYDRWGNKEDPTGCSIITDQGADLGGYSGKEAEDWLAFVRKSGFIYEHKNAVQLHYDKQKILSAAWPKNEISNG